MSRRVTRQNHGLIPIGVMHALSRYWSAYTARDWLACVYPAIAAAFLLVPLHASEIHAQWWVMSNRAYYDPLIAETHAAQINLLFPATSSEFPYSQERGKRVVWNIDLGKETPLFGWESRLSATHHTPGSFAWGLWLPVDFHMVEDLNKDPSSPIIDTDYRFSLMLKAQWYPSTTSLCLGAESCRLGLRVQAGHESTHLGDEFSLAARRNDPTFERINVSYEYWELAPSLAVDVAEMTELTMRLGVIGLLKPANGWYSIGNLDETNGIPLTPSHNDTEWYAGVQWMRDSQWSSGPLRTFFNNDVGWFVSAQARHRNVYDYHRANVDIAEDRVWSVNVMAGLRPARQFLQKGVADVYLRYYSGVNPFGQFRSQRDYRLFGFGIHIEP